MTSIQKISAPIQQASQARLPFKLDETTDYILNEATPPSFDPLLTIDYTPNEEEIRLTQITAQAKKGDKGASFTLNYKLNLKPLEGYKIISPIDKGGMGTVSLALNEQTNEHVAIKIIKDEFLYDERHINRLKREARILQNIQHPNVVNVIDFGLLDQKPALVMEYVKGITLDQLLKSLNLEDLRDLNIFKNTMIQILNALDFVHTNDIIHRDIKPSNVIIDNDGIIKLIDFGLAKINRLDIEDSERTSLSTILGTPEYMAPEQVENSSDCDDPRTDSYAIGVILYKAFTGHGPIDFTNCTKEQVYKRILTEKPRHPNELNPNLHPTIAGTLYLLVQKNPEYREPYPLKNLGRFLHSFDTKKIFTTPFQQLSLVNHL